MWSKRSLGTGYTVQGLACQVAGSRTAFGFNPGLIAIRKLAGFPISILNGVKEMLMNRPSPVAEPVKGQGHILLIDDEEAIVNLGRRSLEKLGYHVTGETRSRAALKRFAEDPTQYDLVITDQTMPDLTGIALAQELWKIRSDLLVIISTGFSETLTLEKASGVGFCALLNKPYTSSELAKTIRQCLCRSQKPESRSQNSEARIQNTRAGSL